MKVLTSAEMREIDRKTIQEIGIPGPVLMENAGIQIAKAILARIPLISKENVVIIAGKGNNGGDGLVVARHLFNRDGRPRVLLLAKKSEVRGDAAMNLAVAEKFGIPIFEISTAANWRKHRGDLESATLIVDAIFGTGLIKPAEGLQALAIEDVNKTRAYKVAADIPSGLSSDTPQILGPAVKADLTVALAAPKVAHVLPPAEDYIGELIVADISIPQYLFESKELKLNLLEITDVSPYFKKREKNTHKGTYGHLFILSGSLGKTGAATMAARAALRAGAGLVTVGTPASCLPMIARSTVELMTEPLPETSAKTLSEEALPRILELLKGKDAFVIGPGLSSHPSTSKLVLNLIPKIKIPTVIDADGLNILAGHVDLLKAIKLPAVLTPHPGEFSRLLGVSNQEVLRGKLSLASEFSRTCGIFLVLKGYRTLVATPQGHVYINPTGNPGMATGGSGDVLSGLIASFVMQEKNVLGATLAAVYAHGLSGDIGASRLGERPLIAGDLVRFFPAAFKEIEKRGLSGGSLLKGEMLESAETP
jgi:hydroxyethylthiazole kinase-like uncharacterized protein yjeF